MFGYIKAENLKCKRTFARKLVIITPIFMLFLAYISGRYFVSSGYNWWYTFIFPGYITLITALVNQNEEKKLHYRAVYSLPVSLHKTWAAKVSLIGIYVTAASLIHMVGIILGKLTYNTASTIPVPNLIAATMLLIITSLWQIPLCLFLAKKIGLTFTVLFNVAGGIALNIILAAKSFWWICPYSFGTRLMCPVLGVLPSGDTIKADSPLMNAEVIPVGVILSVVLFGLLFLATANWFPKQEVK